ncbi:MAG: recombination-associated protein RdgC [Pseudomonadales bacterium]|nr:recombination-associated protein RdgC [Pseudomonadales bacterium]
MWFKNIRFYRFSKPFRLNTKTLQDKLATKAFKPCGKQDEFSIGWVSPFGPESTELFHEINGNIMVCAKKQERVLPSAVINEALLEKVETIKIEQDRGVSRKERSDIRDEVIFDLRPRAFTRSHLTYAYLSSEAQILCVDSSSANKADDFTSLLRESLGKLPAIIPNLKHAPSRAMTRWIRNQKTPADFELQDECELRDTRDESSVVRCKGQDLLGDEVQLHLESGKEVVKLALEWKEQISFVLQDDISIKRLKFSDLIMEQADDQGGDDAASKLDADFALMSMEIDRFIPRLLQVLGGEEET